jgi:hypothetical protein
MVFFAQDYWHSGVDLGDELVGLPGNDCAGAQPLLSGWIFSPLPDTGKDERRIVFHPDRIRDFASDDFLPFVESVRWNQATPFLECLPVRGYRVDRLHRSIDCFVRYFRILSPIRKPVPIAGHLKDEEKRVGH